MAFARGRTLPTVLKEYMPEVEPVCTTTGTDSRTPTKTAEVLNRRSHTGEGHVNPAGKKGGKAGARDVAASQSTSSVSGKHRKKAADAERLEGLSASWQLAKAEVRQERHHQLQEKLALQHHLLHLQDELSKQRRSREEQHLHQQKENDRSKKQAKEAALLEICKQSLADDRKAAAKQRRTPRESRTDDGCHTPPSEQRGRHRSHVSRSPTLPKSPMREMEAEYDADVDLSQSATSSDLDSMPWHHQQLYRLYGEEADYFIHPKIEPKPVVVVSPKLKRHEGHVGAETLWTTLRGESESKLLKEDGRFPHDLKDAYSAFVRESLTLGRQPVTRNYTATDDVPDMKKLLDQKLLYNIRKYRHKTGIMYRSSQANNDRTNILLFNNPLPDITDGDKDNIARYMPSWVESMSDTSEPEYVKWLTSRTQRMLADDTSDTSLHLTADGKEHDTFPAPADTILPPPRQTARDKFKLQFLTEKETQVPGEFARKFREQRERKDLPTAHSRMPSVKAQSSLGFMESRLSDPEERGSAQGLQRSTTDTTKLDMIRRFTSDWQPLSMTALVEYKQQVATEGDGDFQHGRMTMWPVMSS
ncbi:uncharacterized protein [Haliotis cracherodii]|uniref:uncharacterized protein n=1 Tax=Haliotis cracherodii TaxID=6455 RepID=UPI0039E9CB1C